MQAESCIHKALKEVFFCCCWWDSQTNFKGASSTVGSRSKKAEPKRLQVTALKKKDFTPTVKVYV